MSSDIIQSLWIGDRLSVMERLCIQSFLDQGHQFHLYLYAPCDRVPAGATIALYVELHHRALADVIRALLGFCARARLIGAALLAVDGTKIRFAPDTELPRICRWLEAVNSQLALETSA